MGARSRNRSLVGLLVLLAAAATLSLITQASGAVHRHPTGLDPTFGHHGRVIARPPQETEPTEFASAARETNGDVLLELRREPAGATVRELELRRPNGELETSFGKDGRIAVDQGQGVLALPDGDALVGGGRCRGKTGSVLMIDPDGAPVSSFGRDGCGAAVPFAVKRMAVDPQGRILLGGTSEYCPPCGKDTSPGREVVVARLLPDGSLDPRFGNGGSVGTHAGIGLDGTGFDERLELEGLAATADGGVVISTGPGLIRLDPSGALDTGFGQGGTVVGPGYRAGPVIVQPDGSIELVSVESSEGALFVSEYGPSGAPEAGFGENGTERIPTPSGLEQYQLVAAPAPAGGILVGSREPFVRGCTELCAPPAFLVRLTDAGEPDPTYGEGGVAKLGMPSNYQGLGEATALLVAGDGSALLVGASWEPRDAMVEARTPSGAPDPTFGEAGTLTEHRSKSAQLRPTGLAVTPDGGLAILSERYDAPGFAYGYLQEFDQDGGQRPAPDGSPAVKAGHHGALVPVAGGYVVFDEEEARQEKVIHAIGPQGAPLSDFGAEGTVDLPARFVAQAIEPAPDGGCILLGSAAGRSMVVLRLGPDGMPLRDFGHDGLARISFGSDYTIAYDALVEADGDTVVTGWVGDHLGVARLRPDGKLDRGFGDRGRVDGLLGEGDWGDRIAAWPGGGYVIAVTHEGARHRKSTRLIRLGRGGDPVRGFGERGVVDVGPQDRPQDLLVTGHRIVVVTSPARERGSAGGGVELQAYRPDGAIDRAFADDGSETYGGGTGGGPEFAPTAALARPGGKVVVAGTVGHGQDYGKAELLRFRVP